MPVCRGRHGCGAEFEMDDMDKLKSTGMTFLYPCPECGTYVPVTNDEVKEAFGLSDEEMMELKKKLAPQKKKKKNESETEEGGTESEELVDHEMEKYDDYTLYQLYGKKGLDYAKRRLLKELLEDLGVKDKDIGRILRAWDRFERYRDRPSELQTLLMDAIGDSFAKKRIKDIVEAVFSLEIEILRRAEEEKRRSETEFVEIERQLSELRGEYTPQARQPEVREEEPPMPRVVENDDPIKKKMEKLLDKMIDKMIDSVFEGSKHQQVIPKVETDPTTAFLSFMSSMMNVLAVPIAHMSEQLSLQQKLVMAFTLKELGVDPSVVFYHPIATQKEIQDAKSKLAKMIAQHQKKEEANVEPETPAGDIRALMKKKKEGG